MQNNYGNWYYDRARNVLDHLPSDYEVDLDTVTSAAEASDWLRHVAGKSFIAIADCGALGHGLLDYVTERGIA